MSQAFRLFVPFALFAITACGAASAPSTPPPLYPLYLRSIGGVALPQAEHPGGQIIAGEVLTLRLSPITGRLILRRDITTANGLQSSVEEAAAYDPVLARVVPFVERICGPADNCFPLDWVGQCSTNAMTMIYTVREWPSRQYGRTGGAP